MFNLFESNSLFLLFHTVNKIPFNQSKAIDYSTIFFTPSLTIHSIDSRAKMIDEKRKKRGDIILFHFFLYPQFLSFTHHLNIFCPATIHVGRKCRQIHPDKRKRIHRLHQRIPKMANNHGHQLRIHLSL
jgi:hypothetical protein